MKKSVKLYVFLFIISGLFLCVLLLTARNPSSQSDQKLFTLMNSSSTTINFNNKIKDTKESNILLYANFYGGAGVGVGDFNNDGVISVTDLLELLANFGCTSDCETDLNEDDLVSVADLLQILAVFGTICP